jgi:Bacillus transposase protein.
MGLKYTKADGESLVSALTANVSSAEEIINDLQEGVNHLTSQLDNPSSGLSGKAYHAANTLFKQIVVPTLSELKSATTTIQSELTTYKNSIKAFDRYPDTVYDKEEFERLLNIKRQQKALTENHINIFMQALSTALSKTATENLIFEGKGLESVVNHYEKEIRELEEKKQILEEVESQTSSLFEHSLQDFKQALQGAKALKQGSFDSKGNFTFNKNQDMSWYKKLTGKDVSDSLISKKDDKITLEDLLTGNVSKENIQTAEDLKNLAKATGLSLEVVWQMFLTDKKHELNENYQMLKKFIDYSKDQWDKAVKAPVIHDTDKITTTITSWSAVGITVVEIKNETTGEVISQSNDGFEEFMNSFNGGNGEHDTIINGPSKEELRQPTIPSSTEIINDTKDSLEGGILNGIAQAIILSKKDAVKTETTVISGKEYLKNKYNEENSFLEKQRIKEMQQVSGYNGRGN